MVQTTIARIRFKPEVYRDAHAYTAFCRELGLAAVGDTEEAAKASLKMTISSYCNALRRRGLLEKALTESGVRWEAVSLEREADELVVDITP